MSRSICLRTMLAAVALLTALAAPAAEQKLLDFATVDVAQLATQDAQASRVRDIHGTALRVVTGHKQPWPGVTLKAPGGHWDLSPFAQLTAAIVNTGKSPITVSCRVDNPGADGIRNCLTGSVKLQPGQSDVLRVALRRNGDDKLQGKLFGMRGYPVSAGGQGAIDAKNITQILFFVPKPQQDHEFLVETVAAAGTYTPPTASTSDAEPFFPLIDTFGQYRHKDWPGKVHSLAELQARREAEAKEWEAQPGPANWDRYGGWATGPKLEATGFFRTEKVQGKWWLVDPDGRLFFSHGVDCVRMLDTTPIDERQTWFEDFPGTRPEFQEFLGTGYALKGHYAGRSPRCFSFAAANMKRKYGPEWKKLYAEAAHRRLRSWGLNTVANWSDMNLCLMRRTPYTDSIGSHGAKQIEGSEGYWGKFPDVYDPSFAQSARRAMEGKRGASAGDPWCIGYFSDNEMSWGDEVSLGLAALRSPPEQAAKKAFVADLKAKYGEVGKLNAAWGTQHASWDAVLAAREAPDRKRARDDLTAFTTKTAEEYFRTIREAIRAVAPQQLYLGCRFAWVNDFAAAAAGKHCDVVSYNLYRRTVADFKYPGGDKPLIIGEFHFGALDRGMFHTGLVPVENQAARAEAYKQYVLGALRHPQFVGTHWFQWKDEPTTGRVYDEENYQIGLLDVADTPYAETIAATRDVGRQLYGAK